MRRPFTVAAALDEKTIDEWRDCVRQEQEAAGDDAVSSL